MRVSSTDDYEHEYLDLDELLGFYLEQYRAVRHQLLMMYEKLFFRLKNDSNLVTYDRVYHLSQEYCSAHKQSVEFMEFPSRIAFLKLIL